MELLKEKEKATRMEDMVSHTLVRSTYTTHANTLWFNTLWFCQLSTALVLCMTEQELVEVSTSGHYVIATWQIKTLASKSCCVVPYSQ